MIQLQSYISLINIYDKAVFKAETKVITLANHKGDRKYGELRPIKSQVRERKTIGFGFTSDWMKKWRELLVQP